MSVNLNKVAVEEFNTEMGMAYGAGKDAKVIDALKSIGAEFVSGVTGESHRFQRVSKAFMQKRTTPTADVTPANLDYVAPKVILEDFYVAEYSDIFKREVSNTSEILTFVKVFMKALHVKQNQTAIDALEAGTYSATLTDETGLIAGSATGTGQAMSVELLTEIRQGFEDRGIDVEGNVVLFMSTKAKQQLFNDIKFTSGDFNTAMALMNGDMDKYLGFKLVSINDEFDANGIKQQGLGKTGDIRNCYAVETDALGYAEASLEKESIIDWVPTKLSHQVAKLYRAGATLKNNEGVVKVLIDETVTVSA